MSRKRRSRPLLFVLAALGGLFGAMAWPLYVRLHQEGLNRALLQAIYQNRTARALDLLAQGADPNTRDTGEKPPQSFFDYLRLLFHRKPAPKPDGPPALFLAVRQNNDPIVRALLEHGAGDVKYPSLLVRAVQQKNLSIITALLQYGATSLDVSDRQGVPILLLAARNKCPGIVYALLDAGADPNRKDERYATLLDYAAEDGDIHLVKRLLSGGARLDASGPCDPALTAASSKGHLEVVKFLLSKGARINPKKDHGYPCSWALMAAADEGHVEVIKVLLDKGAVVNGYERFGTALCHASEAGRLQVVNVLLAGGADIEAGAYYGGTPLTIAASRGHSKVVKRLLEAGANVNHEERWGITALMNAAYDGNIESIKLLLDYGANVNHLGDKRSRTALMYAIEARKPEVAKFLISRGANVNIKGREGYSAPPTISALYLARSRGYTEIVRLLKRAGARE